MGMVVCVHRYVKWTELKFELQVIASHPTQVLGTKLGSVARAVDHLTTETSPQPLQSCS